MKHVFIVGLPRTGTKLAKNVLQGCQSVCCRISTETWYFGDLFRSGMVRKVTRFGDLRDENNISNLVDYMYSGEYGRTYWRVLSKRKLVDPSWMTQKIIESDRTPRGVYDVIMESAIADAGNECREKEWILGDKTPGHLYHVPKIMEWYPEARVIHTFRDPRAIMASEWKRVVSERKTSLIGRMISRVETLSVIAYVIVTWLYAAHLHKKYSRKYPGRYLLSKYEDLVANPEQSVRILCDHVGIEFDKAMLEPAVVGSSFRDGRTSGFDQGAIERWRNHLEPWMKTLITAFSRSRLLEFGYKP